MKYITYKPYILLLSVLYGLISLSGCRTSHQTVTPVKTETAAPSFTLIIMYDASVGKQPLMKAVKAYGARLLYDYKIIKGIAISIPASRDETKAINYFEKVRGVLSVIKDRKVELH